MNFPECSAPMKICRSIEEINDLKNKYPIVLKPLKQYGGKGMYGHHVHKAVHQNKEKESGMTIHLVDEHYDEGKILFQATTALEASDSPDMIAAKVLKLEHRHYPEQVEKLILSQQKGQ